LQTASTSGPALPCHKLMLDAACSIGKLALRAFQIAVIQAVWTGLSPLNSLKLFGLLKPKART
jgi:hypothetical protein